MADHPNLQATIQASELKTYLARAAELALLLGLSRTELQKRMAEAVDQAQRGDI